MHAVLLVGSGGFLGAVARYALAAWIVQVAGTDRFPWGTLVANVTGCFIIGFLAGVMGPDGRLLVNPNVRQFLLVGFCGGFSTFSSFSNETIQLFLNDRWIEASLNVIISIIACFAATLLGMWLGKAFLTI